VPAFEPECFHAAAITSDVGGDRRATDHEV
jgi:hypothetical protein